MEMFLIVVAAAVSVGVLLFLVLSRYEGPLIDLTDDSDAFDGAAFPLQGRDDATLREERRMGHENP